MKARLGKVAAILIALMADAGCTGLGPSSGAELQIAYGSRYDSPGGTKVYFDNDLETGDGPVAWFVISDLVPVYEDRPAMSEGLGYPLSDCSDGQYRCVQIGLHAVFAIPRRQLVIHQIFEAAGAELEIVACGDASCSLAVVRTRCAFWEMLDTDGTLYRCIREDAGKAADGQPTEFLFDRERGVILFGNENTCLPPLVISDCDSGHAFALKSQVGLLGPGG